MKYVESALIALIALFAPIQAAIFTAFALIILDLITGVMAARKRGEPITSSGLKCTIGKVFLYETSICMSFLVQQFLTGDLFPACKLVTALVGMVELKSCLENMDTISGKNLFQVILTRLLQSKTDLEGSGDRK